MKFKKDEFKLDNSAIVYPPTKTRKWSAMFRLSVTLKENVEVEILKSALKVTLNRLPSFKVTLKKGFLWHYLKQIEGLPPICEDVIHPMESLNIKDNNGFLFRVRYLNNKVFFEYFHCLTDGYGGLVFMLTTIKEYLSIKYKKEFPYSKYILDTSKEFDEKEYSDDYFKYYRKSKAKYKSAICYFPKREKLPDHQIKIISKEVNTTSLKNVARKYEITVGGLLTSIMAYSYYLACKKDNISLPIKVAVPVNLRFIYPSVTLANFTTFVTPAINDTKNDYSFDDIVKIIKEYLSKEINEENINKQFSKMVALEKNFFINLIPLFIKVPIMRAIYLNQNRYFSTTFSNLGNISLQDDIASYIEDIDFMLGQASLPKCIGACVSYQNKTIINLSKTIKDDIIEKAFFETLEMLNIK